MQLPRTTITKINLQRLYCMLFSPISAYLQRKLKGKNGTDANSTGPKPKLTQSGQNPLI